VAVFGDLLRFHGFNVKASLLYGRAEELPELFYRGKSQNFLTIRLSQNVDAVAGPFDIRLNSFLVLRRTGNGGGSGDRPVSAAATDTNGTRAITQLQCTRRAIF